MRQQSLSVVVRHLHRLASRGEMAEVSDVQLLERFVGERHEPAFIALLNRHGAMVFGVCQRILTQTQEAEDAFQATFLALVQKASSGGKRGTVISSHYRVAYRIAMKARVSRV